MSVSVTVNMVLLAAVAVTMLATGLIVGVLVGVQVGAYAENLRLRGRL